MRKAILIVLAIVLLTVIWLFTGGIVVNDYWYYNEMMQLVPTDKKDVTLFSKEHIEQRGVRFLYLSEIGILPYSISVNANDYSVKNSKLLQVEQLDIKFADGNGVVIVEAKDKWEKPFEPHVSYNSTSKGSVRNEYLKVVHTFPAVIRNPVDFSLRIKARIICTDGTVHQVSGEQEFKVERRRSVTTGWKWVSNI